MAAKLLHSLTEDNSDLQKQIGCMTGVFQLFDRNHVLAGKRIAGYSPKRLPHGSSHFNNETLERESNNLHHRPPVMEKNSNKNVHDKLRTSTESSRASFSSSSRSSSFSSLDCNKLAQPETLSFDRIIFPETPSRDPTMSQSSASPQFGRQSLDLRDVVKDSMYRELRALSPKTTIKEEATDRAFNHRDSPRPIQQSKTNDGAYNMGLGIDSKQNMPADLKESLRVLSKLREAPWYFDEPRELSRSKSYQLKEGSSLSSSKDPPRFSYDGREVNRLSFDSQDNAKPALKLKELPRLSLDSRESSMRGLNSDTKSNFQLKSGNRDIHNFSDTAVTVQKTSGTQTRPSVVAQLMGLDTLPHSGSICDNKMGSGLGLITTRRPEDFDSFSRSLKTTEHRVPIRIPSPSRSSLKEPKSPRWKNPDTVVMKPISRFPIEPAPWRQLEGARNSQKPASQKAPAKTQSAFPSVYSEIENRLKHLEFTQSGKDLRALKQILEAMQAKGIIETRNEGQDSHFLTQKNHEQRFSNLTQNARLLNQGKPQGHIISSANRGSTSLRAIDSPIVIMKPAKLVEKSAIGSVDSRNASVNSKTVKDQVPKTSRRDYTVNSSDMKTGVRHTKLAQTSTRNQQSSKESGTSSAKSSGSISPRLQQKKLELEKRARPPTPPDPSKSRKQISRQQAELTSPGGRRRPKFACYQPGDDQSSEISIETRKSTYQETDMAVESDSERYGDSNSSPSLSIKAGVKSPTTKPKPKKSTPVHQEDESFAELALLGQEYPSPVSVLDDVVYIHDSLSPVKHVQKTSNDDVKEQWGTAEDVVSSTTGSGLTSEINRKKLQNVEHLVQKLRRLNSCHDEARTDYIASLCENTNPDDRYISEILLASGLLLRDLGSSLTTFQFHPSGHPINPELFLVLEQTKSSSLLKEEQRKPDKERFHRKLIFDTVNEILVGKLASVGHTPEPWSRPYKLARKTMSAQQLLRDLCMEVTELQSKKPECSEDEDDDGLKGILWEDVNRRSESWTDFNAEIPVMVLEVERLIFKDLVNEIVMHETSGLRAKQQASRRCRQLFVK